MLRQTALFIPTSQYPDIRSFLEIETEILKKIEELAIKATPKVDVEDIAEEIASQIGTEISNVEALFRVALNLNNYKLSVDISAQEAVLDLQDFLSENDFPKWQEQYKDLWIQKHEFIESLLEKSPSIAVMTKARDILYDFQSIVLDFSVLTDVRQIFNSDASNIEGALIVQNIGFEYLEGREILKKHFVLSSEDIKKLISKLQRALKKAEVSEDLLKKLGIINLTPRRNG